MRTFRWLGSAAILALAGLAVQAGSAANGDADYHAGCPGPPVQDARCHAQVVTDDRGNPDATSAPTGLSPQQFHTAYALPTSAPNTQTIGIVDAYNDPTAEAD